MDTRIGRLVSTKSRISNFRKFGEEHALVSGHMGAHERSTFGPFWAFLAGHILARGTRIEPGSRLPPLYDMRSIQRA